MNGRTRFGLRLIASLLLVLPLIVSFPLPAHAVCGSTVDPATDMVDADFVFVGRVTQVSDFGRLATMSVLEIWKGPELPAEVVVNGSFSGSDQIGASDRVFSTGSTYVVVPLGSRSPFFDEACSGTHLYVPTGSIPARFREAVGTDVPRVLGAPATDGPASGEASSGNNLPVFIGSGVGAVLLLWVLLRRYNRRKAGTGGSAPTPATSPSSWPPAAVQVDEPEGMSGNEPEPRPAGAATAVAAVAGRKRRRFRWLRSLVRSALGIFAKLRPSRSGLQNLESVRKKTRRIKEKQQAGAE